MTYVRVVCRFNTAAVGNVRGECARPNCWTVDGVSTKRHGFSTPPSLTPLVNMFNCTESTATSTEQLQPWSMKNPNVFVFCFLFHFSGQLIMNLFFVQRRTVEQRTRTNPYAYRIIIYNFNETLYPQKICCYLTFLSTLEQLISWSIIYREYARVISNLSSANM